MIEYISLSEKAYSIYSVTDKEHDNVSKESRTHTHTHAYTHIHIEKNMKYITNFLLHHNLQIRFNFSCKKRLNASPVSDKVCMFIFQF